ncbi:MAG: hypothetical protein PHQ88_02315 [Bacteroides sp.]|nr:hypothetical protein [Bacteroides sp.]MDD2645134.1 hypothetical protein [Bacteroides sp.]MDD4055010.1 hypothetical protein [Bacteroides sp.]MDD4719682.1 hypothetical protein [Bacteroides sp.]NLI63320.1 hypothetical protein [Bacteroidales bacterium]
MLIKASTRDISQAIEPKTLEDNIRVAKQGGTVMWVAREELELRTGKKVISPINAKKVFRYR